MSSSPSILTIIDPHRTRHPFLVAQPDRYWNCATCNYLPGNGRHREVVQVEPVVMVDDPEYFDQLIAVPLSLVLVSQGGDRLAAAIRAYASPLRTAA